MPKKVREAIKHLKEELVFCRLGTMASQYYQFTTDIETLIRFIEKRRKRHV